MSFALNSRGSQNHGWCAYNTSKSAVLQMARTMACQLGRDRIRVNTISPGYIYTRCVSWTSIVQDYL